MVYENIGLSIHELPSWALPDKSRASSQRDSTTTTNAQHAASPESMLQQPLCPSPPAALGNSIRPPVHQHENHASASPAAVNQQPDVPLQFHLGDRFQETQQVQGDSAQQQNHAQQPVAQQQLPIDPLNELPFHPTTQQAVPNPLANDPLNELPMHPTTVATTQSRVDSASVASATYDRKIVQFMRLMSKTPGLVRLTPAQKTTLTGFLTSLLKDYSVRDEVIRLAGSEYQNQKKLALEFLCSHFPFDDQVAFKSLVRGTGKKDETLLDRIEHSFQRYIAKKARKHHFSESSLAMLSKLNEEEQLQVDGHVWLPSGQPAAPKPSSQEQQEWLTILQQFILAKQSGQMTDGLLKWIQCQRVLSMSGNLEPARRQMLEAHGFLA